MKKLSIHKELLTLMGLATLTACSDDPAENQNGLPNIIVLYTDDMGYGDMMCNNPDSKIPTPNLDRLASQGIRFTDGHSSCAVSTPSRYSILTGNYHWRHTSKVCTNFSKPIMDKDELTVANVLRSKGYYTAAVGKWHLGWDWDSILKPGAKPVQHENQWDIYYPLEMMDWSKPIKGGPCDFGFDYYYGQDCPFHPPYTFIENEHVLEVPTKIFLHGEFDAKEGDSEMRNGPMAESWDPYKNFPSLTDKVCSLIENKEKGKPLFIYYGLPTPHSPIIPNDEFDGKSKAGAYGDFIVETDAHVGRIMEAIQKAGIEKNTIVIFTSDNGPEVYAFARMADLHHNSTTLRGIKRDIYEGGHRVPFIIRWPEVIQPGRVSDEVISQVDLMATFAGIVDYRLPNDKAVDSYDLMPLLKGENYPKPLREATVYTYASAIRKGDWLFINRNTGALNGRPDRYEDYFKYFVFEEYDKKENPGLLFNMKEDRMQRKNLYHEHPEKVQELKTLLEKYKKDGRSIPERK